MHVKPGTLENPRPSVHFAFFNCAAMGCRLFLMDFARQKIGRTSKTGCAVCFFGAKVGGGGASWQLLDPA